MRGAIGPLSQERVNTLIHCEYCVLKDLMANNLIVSTMGPLITEELSAWSIFKKKNQKPENRAVKFALGSYKARRWDFCCCEVLWSNSAEYSKSLDRLLNEHG
jgi:hypothetical protein